MASHTVLIVDDDRDTRIVFGTYLRHHGLRVVEAANGAEATRLLADERPDVVLFDPALGEFEEPLFLALPATRAAAAVSASILPRSVLRALAERRIPLLQKPCSPSELLELVLALLAPVQESAPSTQPHTSRSEESAASPE